MLSRALCVACCLFTVVSAQDWHSIGLSGRQVLDVQPLGPGRGYACTTDGLYYTSDGGTMWNRLYEYGVHPGVRARVLAYEQQPNDAILLAWGWGSRSDGLWFSPDGGANWAVRKYLLFPSVLAAGPEAGSVFLGSDTLAPGLWFSSDTGVTWSRRDQGLATDRVYGVSHSPYCPLVCATNGAGVYISEDTGQSWQSVGPYSTAVTVAAGWHEVWGTVVAAVHGGDSSGIWAADVAGWAWHRELALTDPTCLDIAYLGGILAGGVGDSAMYVREWPGTWRPYCSGLTNRHVLAVRGAVTAWAGTDDGVFEYVFVPGTAEHTTPGVKTDPGSGTIVGRLLVLTRRPAAGLWNRTALFAPDGRTVLDLHDGANDVSHLAPGVYFLESGAEVERVVVVR